ncbi:hypothetical protein HHS34_009835 [Acidithiobacillus montserratensis]|uniref:Uncharacterized protein n=1 Tax=Acidithiobacillus montserratensis TaxID=2729135 RepID=A0ACD5HFR8_9PROT|nr:hypothetical protein [Acidithiobacillus montserratensis]MBN2679296.1 hypothetical protein [Acidithiobacillaceae bacterium]MBU2748414.1 hypothetical protein [Acidithiobacillus montserratensis]
MWDWLRGRSGPKVPPRGVVVDAGIPNQDRVAELPLPEALFVLHYNGFAQLPENAELRQLLLDTARNGEFLRDLPRVSARRLEESHGLQSRFGVELENVVRFFKVLHSEITRRMYIDAARKREDVAGVQFTLRDPGQADVEQLAIVEADPSALGAGVYPLNHIPENPHPGTENPFIIRIVLKKDLA